MRLFAIRSIHFNDMYKSASSIRHDGVWYPVLGYDHTDGTMCLENYQGDDITLKASTIHHSDIRVEASLRKIGEVLDILN